MALTLTTDDLHRRKKLHFDAFETRPATAKATAILAVETEPARRESPCHRFGSCGKEVADGLKDSGIGRGVRTRASREATLMDFDDAIDELRTSQRTQTAARPARQSPMAFERRNQNAVNKTRLSRARHARDGDQPPQGYAHVHILEIV